MKKRKDGRYQKKVVVQRNGQAYIKWVYGKTRADVQRKEDDFKAEIDSMAVPTVSQLVEKYHDPCFQRYSYLTAMHYDDILKAWCERCGLENARITDVRAKDVMQYVQELADQGMASSSIHNVITAIRNIYNFAAVEYDDMQIGNPAVTVLVPVNAKPAKKVPPPSKEDLQNVVNGVGLQFGLFAYLMLYSGLRRSEALALKWEDCYDGYIHVRHSIIFDRHGAAVDRPYAKTAAGIRDVPIFPPLQPYLKHGKRKKGYIFSRDGKPLKETWYNSAWDKYRLEAHVSCTPHQLRHAFCTTCYESGVDAKVCAAWMGHASITTTLNIYTSISLEQEKEESEKMVELYKKQGLTNFYQNSD